MEGNSRRIQKKIIKAVAEGNIDLAKQMFEIVSGVAKIVLGGNPTEGFNPVERACADSVKTGLLGDRHFDIEKFNIICQRRGLLGSEIWSQPNLTVPLRLFAKEAKNMKDEQIEVLLNAMAEALDLERNLLKRHFYAIKFDYEYRFLAEADLGYIVVTKGESEEFEETEEEEG